MFSLYLLKRQTFSTYKFFFYNQPYLKCSLKHFLFCFFHVQYLPLTCSVSLFTCLDQSQRGSLFTLFLYSPLLAFSSVCGLNSIRKGLWERAQEFLRKVYRDIGQMITRSRTIGTPCLIDSPRKTISDPCRIFLK